MRRTHFRRRDTPLDPKADLSGLGMSNLRSLIIVLALFAVLLSALATEGFRPCADNDHACRGRTAWYTFPVARVLSQMQEQSSIHAKTPPATLSVASPLP